MSKPVILTGLRANNDLHIGNYFGALMPLIDMARTRSDEYQINLFVPDLHSFTMPINHDTLADQILHNLKLYVAAGLDLSNPAINMYRQSYVAAHSELTWMLDCFTGMGEMSRMTQFKDKSAKLGNDRISVGMFHYPVLMAADILLYGALYVPVGEDQSQHLEFTRDIAIRMNNQFGELFTVPIPVAKQHAFFGKDQALRIRDLLDPLKKMSKSDETGKGVIFLGDDPAIAAKKVMGATTDSFGEIRYDMRQRPGISNLLQILTLLSSQNGRPSQTLQETIEQWEGKTSYGNLKKAVAEAVQRFLIEFQARLGAIDIQDIQSKLNTSETAMNLAANQTLLRAQQALGLRPKA